ncbi:hypothetical protein C7B62_17430 [Pleurocapsa sp. CCALA 161]|uniref:hypothetical protein n=1 Tax=Pleurocapsa sp. CCALA 161 TaxID=2107688 RepID=UPI000D04F7F7|nr:hypothetical protein [Pleurocapsa sp. CCALA 161]PSB08207.1 hypothetical protein C7B62_17430 [Pleurocapsa sp. CCALA 161]
MIISDLQYIESANETEVQATGGAFNQAGANGLAEAFGKNTKAFSYTSTLTIQGQFSGAASSSYSESY